MVPFTANSAKLRIRNAAPAEAERFSEIYRHYVLNTAVTFEVEPPDAEEFRRRIGNVQKRYPWLVAEEITPEGRRTVGYAYAGAFKARAAYDWSCELSIYVERGLQGRGYGRRLYDALSGALGQMGIRRLYACIAAPEQDDEYLTSASVRFHEHLGFRVTGRFEGCANKFGRWYNMVWMVRENAALTPDPAPLLPWTECPDYPLFNPEDR